MRIWSARRWRAPGNCHSTIKSNALNSFLAGTFIKEKGRIREDFKSIALVSWHGHLGWSVMIVFIIVSEVHVNKMILNECLYGIAYYLALYSNYQ